MKGNIIHSIKYNEFDSISSKNVNSSLLYLISWNFNFVYIFIYTIKAQRFMYIFIYLFVCSELIEETGRFPNVIFGI